MERQNVHCVPARLPGLTLSVGGVCLVPSRSASRTRAQRNGGAVFATDAHLRPSVQAGDDREPVKLTWYDFVPDDTAVAEFSWLGSVHHFVDLSFSMQVQHAGPSQ